MTTMHRQVYLITQRSFSLDKILENSRQYYPILTFYSKLKLVQTKKAQHALLMHIVRSMHIGKLDCSCYDGSIVD